MCMNHLVTAPLHVVAQSIDGRFQMRYLGISLVVTVYNNKIIIKSYKNLIRSLNDINKSE